MLDSLSSTLQAVITTASSLVKANVQRFSVSKYPDTVLAKLVVQNQSDTSLVPNTSNVVSTNLITKLEVHMDPSPPMVDARFFEAN